MKLLFSRLSTIAMLAWAIISISSCNNEDVAASKTPLLTDKTWIVVKYEVDGVDVTDDRDECETDNTTTFFSDGTYVDKPGDLLCDEFETEVEGSWTFKANETIISIHPAGEDPMDWKILELTDNRFKVSQYIQLLDAEVTVLMAPK